MFYFFLNIEDSYDPIYIVSKLDQFSIYIHLYWWI